MMWCERGAHSSVAAFAGNEIGSALAQRNGSHKTDRRKPCVKCTCGTGETKRIERRGDEHAQREVKNRSKQHAHGR